VRTALEATQGQFDGFFSQLPYTYHQNRVASVGDSLKICPWVTSRVEWEKIVVFETPGLHCRSPDSGRPRYKSRELEGAI